MEAGATRLARVRLPAVSAVTLRRLSFLALGALVLIVITGATVRLTDSGLGCENWPRCGSTFLPQQGSHAFIEFGNRVVGVLVGLSTLAAALAAWRTPGAPRWLVRAAIALPLLVLAQGILGGITVLVHLHPLIVMGHFLLSLLAVAVAVVVAFGAWELSRGRLLALRPDELGVLALSLLPPTLVLVVTGTLVTAAGPHSGGEHVRRFGNLVDAVHVHVGAAAVFGIGFLALVGLLVRRRAGDRLDFWLGLAILVALVVQMAVGDVQWREHLPRWLVLGHVALATVVWTGMVGLAVSVSARRQPRA